VQFPAEALDGLDAVAEKMKGLAQTKGFDVVGYVTRLDRPADVDAEGDVVLVPIGDDTGDVRRISVHLSAEDYNEAIAAHQTGVPVHVVGTLRKSGRRWFLSHASGFERIPDESDNRADTGAGGTP
jgi:hypothetical protein